LLLSNVCEKLQGKKGEGEEEKEERRRFFATVIHPVVS
jgi:hypothetical protein